MESTYLIAGKPSNGDILTELGNGFFNQILDRGFRILDVRLFQKSYFGIEFLHLAWNDLFDLLRLLAFFFKLGLYYLLLALDFLFRNLFGRYGQRSLSGDLHADIFAKLSKIFVTSNEVRFAIKLQKNANVSFPMDVGKDSAYTRSPVHTLGRFGQTFGAEGIRGFLDISPGALIGILVGGWLLYKKAKN